MHPSQEVNRQSKTLRIGHAFLLGTLLTEIDFLHLTVHYLSQMHRRLVFTFSLAALHRSNYLYRLTRRIGQILVRFH